MFSIKIMLRYYLYQLLPFKNCRHWADFIILEMLWWRFWKRQSGEFCTGCNWIPCFCVRYHNAAITEYGSLSRDAMFCSPRIVHPYRRNQPWFQVYTSVCPRGARREKALKWVQTSFVGLLVWWFLKSTLTSSSEHRVQTTGHNFPTFFNKFWNGTTFYFLFIYFFFRIGIFYSPYIHGANFIAKFRWKSSFLKGGFHGTPLGTNGSKSTLVT